MNNRTMTLFDNSTGSSGLTVRLAGQRIQAGVRNGGSATRQVVDAVGSSQVGVFQNIVVTYDNGRLSVYYNGPSSKASVDTGPGPIAGHSDPVAIGRQTGNSAFAGGTGGYFAGLIDDVRVWDGVALTDEEVDALWVGSRP